MPTAPDELNAERDIPKRRMPFATGNCALSNSREISSNAIRPSIAPRTEWLRVICRKSAYLIFSVTVRPCIPVFSQWRQTLSIIGASASRASSKVKRSTDNVLGADRLADAVGEDRTVVDAARDPIVIGPRLAEMLSKKRHRLRSQIQTGSNVKAGVAGPWST